MYEYVIADTHFGHDRMSKFEPSREKEAKRCGYRNFDGMIMHRWNQIITDKTKILHLGDVAFGDSYLKLGGLIGDITLLVGNHDKDKALSYYKELGWNIIDSIILDIPNAKEHLQSLKNSFSPTQLSNRLLCALVVDVEDERILFSHFPLFDDNPYDKKYREITEVLEVLYLQTNCTLNIHGHTHSTPAKEDFCKSACLEMTDYEIKSMEYFLNL